MHIANNEQCPLVTNNVQVQATGQGDRFVVVMADPTLMAGLNRLECRLCVAACPVGAISNEGGFNFLSCYTHNYREYYHVSIK
jgi:ferredoxin